MTRDVGLDLDRAVEILRAIVDGWPNDDEQFDQGIRDAETFLEAVDR